MISILQTRSLRRQECETQSVQGRHCFLLITKLAWGGGQEVGRTDIPEWPFCTPSEMRGVVTLAEGNKAKNGDIGTGGGGEGPGNVGTPPRAEKTSVFLQHRSAGSPRAPLGDAGEAGRRLAQDWGTHEQSDDGHWNSQLKEVL